MMTAQRLAKWWDSWKAGLPKEILIEARRVKRCMTRSYRQRQRRLHRRLNAAQLATQRPMQQSETRFTRENRTSVN
ncbi:hypothetical protein CCR75_005518 [Bremia lactucae]|uniref:Uncharacterized protein n=1 Tax=Bremia lactucae TaxID=4779 RepID=A0A976IC07_BRELC|nr:hypothetical protein CCR75_005518 [Bremia lactucae]